MMKIEAMTEELIHHIEAYQKQMELRSVPQAYRGLLEYSMSLRTHFINQYPTEFIVGSFYQGRMTISYFPITPISLKSQKLKFGLVLNHEKVRFEIWLLGRNKQVQKEYWDLLKGRGWNQYALSPTGQHSIVEHVLVENPDFSQLDALTGAIDKGTLRFIKDIVDVLA